MEENIKQERQRIGDLLKEARLALGWSQLKMAHKMGVDHSVISGIENGRFLPTQKTCEKLGKILEVPPTTFLSPLARGLRKHDLPRKIAMVSQKKVKRNEENIKQKKPLKAQVDREHNLPRKTVDTQPTTPLGKLIRDARLEKNWTQAMLAKALGIPTNVIASYEQGKVRPNTRKRIEQLAEILEINQEELLSFWLQNENDKRVCKVCHKEKELERDFYSQVDKRKHKPTYSTICKQCHHDIYIAKTSGKPKQRSGDKPRPPFAQLIRDARIRKGWRQHTLANALGLSRKSIEAYENRNKQPPQRETVEQLADLLEIDKEELLAHWKHNND